MYLTATLFSVLVLVLVQKTPLVLLQGNSGPGQDKVGLVVLGGGVTANGGVPEHTKLRLDKAISLLSANPGTATFIITLSGGTPHKPNPTDSQGFPVTEAKAAAKHLLDRGVPASQILEEAFSLDTLGNAYFLRTMHAEAGKFTKLVIITNSWHMARTRAMFTRVFDLPARSSGRAAIGRRWTLEFVEVPSGLDPATLAAREEREKASLAAFERETSRKLGHSMQDLHHFMFQMHSDYASSRLTQPREPLDPKVLATY